MLVYLQMIEGGRDKNKFDRIYKDCHDLMFHVAQRYLDNDEDSEDAVHQAFVKIAENIKIIEEAGPRTRQLAVMLTERAAIDALRKRSRSLQAPLDESICAAAAEYIPEEDLLSRSIMELEERQRNVIWLKYYHGYSLKEIAKMLKISLANAQKIDQRAKAKLKEIYLKNGGIL